MFSLFVISNRIRKEINFGLEKIFGEAKKKKC